MTYVTKGMEILEQWIETWTASAKPCAIVYGGVGVGKTFTVKYVAERKGYVLLVFGEDSNVDIEDIIRACRTVTLSGKNKIILLDRPLLWMTTKQLRDIIKNTRYPIIIECGKDELKYYQWLGCSEIYIEPPPKTWIAKELKSKGVCGINWKLIGEDVRQAQYIAMGASTYTSETWIDRARKFFKQGTVDGLEKSHLPILLDTAVKYYYGVDLLNMIQALIAADISGKLEVLEGLKPTLRFADIEMYFYQKLKALKESEQLKS